MNILYSNEFFSVIVVVATVVREQKHRKHDFSIAQFIYLPILSSILSFAMNSLCFVKKRC